MKTGLSSPSCVYYNLSCSAHWASSGQVPRFHRFPGMHSWPCLSTSQSLALSACSHVYTAELQLCIVSTPMRVSIEQEEQEHSSAADCANLISPFLPDIFSRPHGLVQAELQFTVQGNPPQITPQRWVRKYLSGRLFPWRLPDMGSARQRPMDVHVWVWLQPPARESSRCGESDKSYRCHGLIALESERTSWRVLRHRGIPSLHWQFSQARTKCTGSGVTTRLPPLRAENHRYSHQVSSNSLVTGVAIRPREKDCSCIRMHWGAARETIGSLGRKLGEDYFEEFKLSRSVQSRMAWGFSVWWRIKVIQSHKLGRAWAKSVRSRRFFRAVGGFGPGWAKVNELNCALTVSLGLSDCSESSSKPWLFPVLLAWQTLLSALRR